MKTPEQERLLRDVLRDESYLGFRAQVRDAMLAELRARRHFQRRKQLLALAACVALALGVQWILTPRDSRNIQLAHIPMVRSVSLKPEQLVTTAGHAGALAVIESRDIEVSSLRLGIVQTVTTLPGDTLTDEQLLDLFKGRAVALVNSTNGKKVLFLDEKQEPDVANPGLVSFDEMVST